MDFEKLKSQYFDIFILWLHSDNLPWSHAFWLRLERVSGKIQWSTKEENALAEVLTPFLVSRISGMRWRPPYTGYRWHEHPVFFRSRSPSPSELGSFLNKTMRNDFIHKEQYKKRGQEFLDSSLVWEGPICNQGHYLRNHLQLIKQNYMTQSFHSANFTF